MRQAGDDAARLADARADRRFVARRFSHRRGGSALDTVVTSQAARTVDMRSDAASMRGSRRRAVRRVPSLRPLARWTPAGALHQGAAVAREHDSADRRKATLVLAVSEAAEGGSRGHWWGRRPACTRGSLGAAPAWHRYGRAGRPETRTWPPRRSTESVASIGPYRIEALLGRGGMGVVYRALDTRLGRPVALKLLSAELSDDAAFRARFERESRLAASIDHARDHPDLRRRQPPTGLLYIAMRYVDGDGPLRGCSSPSSHSIPPRAVDLCGQLAERARRRARARPRPPRRQAQQRADRPERGPASTSTWPTSGSPRPAGRIRSPTPGSSWGPCSTWLRR